MQDVDELKRCLTAVCADIKHSVIDKAVDEWQLVCPLPRDDTLNTSFAEYLAFSLILLFFYRCTINSVVPRCQKLGGTCPRQLYGAGAYGFGYSYGRLKS